MLIECDRFALFKGPAASATAGTLEAITAANFLEIVSITAICALENNGGHGQVVGVFHVGIPCGIPQGKDNVKVCGQFTQCVNVCVHDVVAFCKGKDLAMGILLCGDYHFFEICRIGDITGNMEAEVTRHFDGLADLAPVFVPVVVQDIQIAIVAALDILVNAAHLDGVALGSTRTTGGAGNDGRQAHGRDSAHFAIPPANRNGLDNILFFVHNLKYPFSIDLVVGRNWACPGSYSQ